MSEAATAAAYNQSLTKNADPIGSYAMGVQMRAKLLAIDAAVPAEIFQNTMNLMKLADARSDREQKAQLAAKELEIATYNAETNRINANRPRTGTFTGSMGVGATQWRDEGDGSFTPITLGTGQPGGATSDMPVQMPTSGEGDTTVAALGESGEIGVLPGGAAMQGQTGFAPLPGMGDPAVQKPPPASTGSHIPGVASPFGVAPARPSPDAMGQTSATPQAKTGLKGTHKLSFTVDAYGRETKRYTPIDPKDSGQAADAPVQPAPPEVLEKYSALYDGFGKVAVPTNDKAYPQGFKLEDKPTLHGKSIADLSADEQKRFGDLAQEVLTLAEGLRASTPEAKMAAVGISDPKLMTDELWKKGYQIVQADPNTPVDPASAKVLMQKATQLAAFKNYMLDTNVHQPEMILSQMGVDTKGMMPQAQQQPAGREVAVSGMGQATRGGEPEPAQATGRAPSGANAPQPEVAALQQQIATEKDPNKKYQLENKLAIMQQAGKAESSGPKTTADQLRDQAAQNAEIFKKRVEGQRRGLGKDEENNEQWTKAKFDLLKSINATGSDVDEVDYLGPRAPKSVGNVSYGMQKWFDANKDKLSLNQKGGGKLTLDSTIFTDKDGRAISLREVYHALLRDPTVRGKKEAEKEKGGLSGAEMALIK